MKTIAVDEKTWKKLKEIREKLGTQSYNELINILIEKWHISELKEHIDSLELDLSPETINNYFRMKKQGVGRK